MPSPVEHLPPGRLEEMREGMLLLEHWLEDAVRLGLAVLETREPDYWTSFAARLVDAKLGSLGRRIRLLAEGAGQEGWQDMVLETFAGMYLLARSFRKLETLPELLQYEILIQSGWTLRKADLAGFPPVEDTWFALSREEGREEQLRFRRTWLWGIQTRRYGLLLEYVFGPGAFEYGWEPGQAFRGSVVFYPSPVPQRLRIWEAGAPMEAPEWPSGHMGISSFLTEYSKGLEANPFLEHWPVLIESCLPAGGRITDGVGDSIPFHGSNGWEDFAAGQAVALFGEWHGRFFKPLIARKGDRLFRSVSVL